jgi:hypothetical protein
MQRLKQWVVRPLDLLKPDNAGSADERLERGAFYRFLFAMREWPDIAMQTLAGVFEPVHQRTMMRVAHRGAGTYVNVSSRGTSKSSTLGVQYPVYRFSFWTRTKGVLLSASGFRGGQGLFNDLSRMVKGGWDSQVGGLDFLRAASTNPKIIHRAANFWEWGLTNFSAYKTLPTKDPDGIRGERANLLFVDESNFVREDLIERVAKPFLNVKTDFEHGGAYAQSNSVYYTTTVDYAWRPFGKVQDATWGELVADYEAVAAVRRRDKQRYLARAKEGFAKHAYVCFDYTDTFIRQSGKTRNGRRYTVHWPNAKLPLVDRPSGLPFTERARSGALKQRGSPTKGWSTYPIDFDAVEGGLYDGSTPVEAWLSEQKNVRDTAQGDVFPSHLLDEVCFTGDRWLIPYDDCTKAWREQYVEEMRDYAPQVLYRCSDPCVVGMDYAGGERDFCAMVVIRVGPLATGVFDPYTGLGQTPWCNVIWAEQHRLMSHEDAADKLRQFAERYNLVYYAMPGMDDDWRVCRAIGLDMRGGGTGVRDQLVYINSTELTPEQFRIYDPLDTDPRVQAFARDPKAKPMLDAISPTDILNDRLVEFINGQLQKKLIYLAKYLPDALRPSDDRADVSMAYNAIKTLEHQLRKIQQEPTKNARRFYMAGDTEKTEKKKDLFSAFIYGMKQVRAHLIRHRAIDMVRAEASAERVVLGGSQNPKLRAFGGRAPGSKW